MRELDLKLDGYDKSIIGLENIDFQWCNVKLEFINKYFNYSEESDILQIPEIKRINEMLHKCLSNQLSEDVIISFDEPDIDFKFHKGIVDGEHRVELRIYMLFENIGYTDNYYSVLLCDNEIKLLNDFFNEFIRNNYE